MLTSAGTGTGTPPAGLLEASDNTRTHTISQSAHTCLNCRKPPGRFHIFEHASSECSPDYAPVLSVVLAQQTDFQINGSAGLSGARAVYERDLCVFITLSRRISPNT